MIVCACAHVCQSLSDIERDTHRWRERERERERGGERIYYVLLCVCAAEAAGRMCYGSRVLSIFYMFYPHFDFNERYCG